MGYVYGIGASVVMIGAYFKLTHIPGADFMLGLGLGVEALIFFLSAFEPQHLDYQWDNVFTELDEEWDGETRTKFDTSAETPSTSVATPQLNEAVQHAMAATYEYTNALEQATRTLNNFTSKFDVSGIDTESLKKVATSMQTLSSSYELQLKSMEQSSNASSKLAATMTSYMDNLNASANNANELNKQLNQLSSRLSALNSVYSGMLSAMNIKA